MVRVCPEGTQEYHLSVYVLYGKFRILSVPLFILPSFLSLFLAFCCISDVSLIESLNNFRIYAFNDFGCMYFAVQ